MVLCELGPFRGLTPYFPSSEEPLAWDVGAWPGLAWPPSSSGGLTGNKESWYCIGVKLSGVLGADHAVCLLVSYRTGTGQLCLSLMWPRRVLLEFGFPHPNPEANTTFLGVWGSPYPMCVSVSVCLPLFACFCFVLFYFEDRVSLYKQS